MCVLQYSLKFSHPIIVAWVQSTVPGHKEMTSASKELEQEVSESFHYLGYGGWVACVQGPNCWVENVFLLLIV